MDRQPTRSKRVREDRRFDKTQLKSVGHGKTVHRDYLAHALRWQFVANTLNTDTADALGFWLAGLVDGEGSFLLNVARREDHAHVFFVFAVALREDDQNTLLLVQRILGNGQFQKIDQHGNHAPQVRYTITGRKNLLAVADFFDRYPLQSKKRADFEIWSEALRLYDFERSSGKSAEELFDQMTTWSDKLKHERRYDVWQLRQERPDLANQFTEYPRFAEKYGWIQRQLKQGARILDVGCGQEQPLVYVIGARLNTVPSLYVGVDLNRISKKNNVRWAKIHDDFDFVSDWRKLRDLYGTFDVVTCYETIEHMDIDDGDLLLEGLREMLSPDGRLFLSTPVFNGSAAANHIHEYTIPELKQKIESNGLAVANRIGTFASKPEIYYSLSDAERKVFDGIYDWLGNEVTACVFAKLYPDASRNNLWVCRKPE